jgi:hypothetical protein
MEMLIIVHTCWLNTYSWVSQCSTGIWDGKFNVTFSKGQQLELNSACHMCWVSKSKATQLVKSCCVHSSIGVCKYVGLVFVLECSTKVTKQLSPIWKRLKIVAPQQVDCVILITYFVRSKTVKIIGMKKIGLICCDLIQRSYDITLETRVLHLRVSNGPLSPY